MAGENLETVRGLYEEFATGNLRAGADLYAHDVTFMPLVERSTVRGREEVTSYMREFLQQWNDFRIEAEEFTEVGGSVIVKERQHATGKSSGVEMTQAYYAVWSLEDGRIVEMRWEHDRDTALEWARRAPS